MAAVLYYHPAFDEQQITPDQEINWQRLVTPEVRQRFSEDAVILIKQARHPEWLQLVEMAYQRVMLTPETMARYFRGKPGAFLASVHKHPNVLETRQLLIESPIADIIGSLVEPGNIWYFLDEFLIKEGGNCGPAS